MSFCCCCCCIESNAFVVNIILTFYPPSQSYSSTEWIIGQTKNVFFLAYILWQFHNILAKFYIQNWSFLSNGCSPKHIQNNPRCVKQNVVQLCANTSSEWIMRETQKIWTNRFRILCNSIKITHEVQQTSTTTTLSSSSNVYGK